MTAERREQLDRARSRSLRPNQLAAARVWIEQEVAGGLVIDAAPAFVVLRILDGKEVGPKSLGEALNWLRKHAGRRSDPLHAEWANCLLESVEDALSR